MLVEPVKEMPSAFYDAYADIFEIIEEVGRAYHHLAMASEDEWAEWHENSFNDIVDTLTKTKKCSVHIFKLLGAVLALGAKGEVVRLPGLSEIALPILGLKNRDLRMVKEADGKNFISSRELESRYNVRIQVPVNAKEGLQRAVLP